MNCKETVEIMIISVIFHNSRRKQTTGINQRPVTISPDTGTIGKRLTVNGQ